MARTTACGGARSSRPQDAVPDRGSVPDRDADAGSAAGSDPVRDSESALGGDLRPDADRAPDSSQMPGAELLGVLRDVAVGDVDLSRTLDRLVLPLARSVDAQVRVVLPASDGSLRVVARGPRSGAPPADGTNDRGKGDHGTSHHGTSEGREAGDRTGGVVPPAALTELEAVRAEGASRHFSRVTSLPPEYGRAGRGPVHCHATPLSGIAPSPGVLWVERAAPWSPTAIAVVAEAARRVGLTVAAVREARAGQQARAAIDALTDAVLSIDEGGAITCWNDGAARLYGYTAEQALGRPVADVLRPAAGDPGERNPVAGAAGDGDWTARREHIVADGSTVSVQMTVTGIGDPGGARPGGALIVVRDIQSELLARDELARQAALAQAALNASPMLTAVVDGDGQILAASREWMRRTGEGPGGALGVGSGIDAVVDRFTHSRQGQDALRQAVLDVARGAGVRAHQDHDVPRDGGPTTFSVHVSHVPGVGAAVTVVDITDRATRERGLSFDATHDSLTRLPNRGVLLDRAAQAIHRAARSGARVGMILCDLDGFKDVNDRHGHGTGDEVLQGFAQRLVDACRSTDTVSRLHGDEFAILVDDAVDEDTTARIAQRIIDSASRPLAVVAGEINVGASVGLVVTEPDLADTDAQDLVDRMLQRADAAMYRAKQRGRGRFVAYDHVLAQQAHEEGIIVGDVLTGAREGKFLLHFQPRFGVGGRLSGAEALLRWDHPVRGVIAPFQALSKLGSLPLAMGDWILGQATAVLAFWEPWLPEPFRLAVNVSRSQWLDADTPDVVAEWLARHGARADRLCLEVGPQDLSDDAALSARSAHRLRTMGVELAVNDFGVGSGNLADLAGIPIDSVTMGRRVVRDVGEESDADRTVAGCIAFASALGWRATVTGVERQAQREASVAAGADELQGFGLGRPVAEHEYLQTYLDGGAGPAGDS